MNYKLTSFFSLLLLAASAAIAQQAALRATPADPAVSALVGAAIENTPELAAARAAVEAAKRRIEPARTLADPMLSTSYQNDGRAFSLGAAEGSFIGLMLSQPLPWPGKLSLAAKTAASEAREIEAGTLGRAGLTIEARVRDAWYDLVLARAVDKVVDEHRETARDVEETTRARYAAGLAVQQDVLRAQVELARTEEQKAAQRAAIVSRLAELNRLIGKPQDAPLDTPAVLPATEAIPEGTSLIASVTSRSPEMAAAKQGLETDRLRVDVAKKNFLPDFVVSGGSMYRGNFAMGPMWQVAVGINLPIHAERRQKNQVAEAEARVAERTALQSLIAQELELRTRQRIAQLASANDVAALYRDKVVPLDQLSLESALASYRASKVPFVTVLDAVHTLYADQQTYLERLAEAAKWRVAIDEASLDATGAAVSSPKASSSGNSPSSATSM